MINDDTIVALSTPPGKGAIAVIRVSGADCFKIVQKILPLEIDLEKLQGFTVKHTSIIDPEKFQIIDDALITVFRAPKSFTGENVIELSVHGGLITPYRIINALVLSGARLSEKGEFTKRAFLNDKIDLTQAEAISDLISSKTITGSKIALSNIYKRFSNEVNDIKNKLLNLIANIEVCIDYPEEGIEEAGKKDIIILYEEIKERINKIIINSHNGRRISDGVLVVLTGKTNVGKSSILNYLAKEERAIVSSVHGTTRDALEINVEIEGVPLTLVDTAGLREAGDELERLGKEKTHKYLEEAHLIIIVFDASAKIDDEDIEIIEKVKNKDLIAVINKCDLKKVFNTDLLFNKINRKCPIIEISALEKKGIEGLEKELSLWVRGNEIGMDDNAVIASMRAENLLLSALKSLEIGIDLLNKNEPYEFIALSFREAINNFGDITGEVSTEDILNVIFENFCVGK